MRRQLFLPGFPEGSAKIGDTLSILQKDGRITYFVSGDNYYSHRKGDTQSQRFALSTLMENGHVRACDLESPPLSIPHRTLMNWGGQLRKEGPGSFFRSGRLQNARVMTPEKVSTCGRLLADGMDISDVARRTGIGDSTLRKAIERGAVPKLPEGTTGNIERAIGTTKGDRSRADAEAASGMGTACTRSEERVAAAMGLAECATV